MAAVARIQYAIDVVAKEMEYRFIKLELAEQTCQSA